MLLTKGYLNEGWVDPRKYLLAVRSKAAYLGTEFVTGKLIGFEGQSQNAEFIDFNRHKIQTALVNNMSKYNVLHVNTLW